MNIIEIITASNDSKAYEKTKEIIAISKFSNEYYKYFDNFISMLKDTNSYIRTRAFLLICAQAKWDKEEKIKKVLPNMLELFHDTKPTVVRQCLKAIKEVFIYIPEIKKTVIDEIETIDLSKYNDSMSPLIKKDIEEITKY